MPHFDLPLDELRTYSPKVSEPADFDKFWAASIAAAQRFALTAAFQPVNDSIYRLATVEDAGFCGFDGQTVRGWMLRPTNAAGKLPCVVSYVGYGGGRSLPIDHLAPLVAGLAHFVMDTRGQGSGWSPGDTSDEAVSGPSHPGFMTRGIESRETYYYRRVMIDAVRAVEAAAAHPGIDANRIAVCGGSQGGGLALAAAALCNERVKACVADVPFLCHFRRATQIIDTRPYAEIAAYLAIHRNRTEQVFETLSYFDCVNFAPRIKARTLVSVGLMDNICPPSTVFAAFNRIVAPRNIRVYDYNNHEGGGVYQAVERLRFLADALS